MARTSQDRNPVLPLSLPNDGSDPMCLSYSLRICLIRAIASSTACSGLMPSVTMRWIAFSQIPVGTRKIKVRLDIDQVSGASPNVAIDDVTLEIDPGDLRYLTFAVWQVSAQVGRGFASEATVEIVP